MSSFLPTEPDYRLLFDHNPQPMWVYEVDTLRILAVNESAVEKYGYSKEEFLNMTIEQLRLPEDVPALHQRVNEIRDSRAVTRHWRHRRKDGSLFIVDITSSPTLFGGKKARLVHIHDVSDEVRAQEALNLSEIKLKNLMETTTAGIFFYRGNHFSFVNHAMENITGFARSELLRQEIWGFVHPEQREAIRARGHARQRGEPVPSRYELKIITKSGDVRWIDLAVESIAVDGELAFMGTAIDITERHLTEEALRKSEERFHALFKQNPLMCFIVRSDGVVLDVNEACERQLGYMRNELLEKPVVDFFLEEDREKVRENIERCLSNGFSIYEWELRKVHKNGNVIHVNEVAQVVGDSSGNPTILIVCEDITERYRFQASVRESEVKFRTFTETTDAAVFIYYDQSFRYVNPSMERITGYTREELQKLLFTKVVITPRRDLVNLRIAARAEGKEVPSRSEQEILTKRGTRRWVDIATTVTHLGGRKVLMGTAVDITERRRAETELRRSEELTHRILEAVPAGMIEVAQDGKILQANVEAQEFFGTTALDFLRGNIRDFADRVIQENGKPIQPSDFTIARCLETGEDQPSTTMGVRRADGSISWGVFTAVPLMDISSGVTNGAVLTFLNITGRKQMEDALRDSEERYRKFFEEDLTGDFIASNDGCILACNPAFATIFGFESVESALYSNLNSIYRYEHAFEKIVEALNTKKKIEYHEALGKRRDGKAVYVIENLIGLFDSNNRLVGVKGYVFDNTAHKTLEQQVQEAAKIEGLGRLAGGVAHDFNNLLNIILGYSEKLAKSTASSATMSRDVQAILIAAQRGTNLVKQLLTFARKADVSFEETNINSIVEELSKLLGETFPRTIALNIDIEQTAPPIIGDATQLHQALLNLCVNARDAMPTGGTLTITTETVTGFMLRETYPEADADFYVCVGTTDTGVGINEETRRNIFEPFFSTKERGKGTGLGLAVVHGIVKSHHGFVEVVSEIGKGATFKLYFPVPQKAVQTARHDEQQQEEVRGGNETILFVEDEDLLRDLVQQFLESKGYKILVAADGVEAVEMFTRHRNDIDLVITDLGLPRLGGWEAYLQMKKLHPQIRVIVASGYLDPTAKQHMTLGGVRTFVHKPYLAGEIASAVRGLLDADPPSRASTNPLTP